MSRTGSRWSRRGGSSGRSRFPTQWLAPYAATHLDGTGAPADEIARTALAATVDDLLNFVPGIVFINENPRQAYFKGAPLDYLAFWRNDPRFPAFWSDYRKHGSVDGFGVYVRNKGEGPTAFDAVCRTIAAN